MDGVPCLNFYAQILHEYRQTDNSPQKSVLPGWLKSVLKTKSQNKNLRLHPLQERTISALGETRAASQLETPEQELAAASLLHNKGTTIR